VPEVVLTVNGKRHSGWKSVSVSSSMKSLAMSFDVSFSDRWPGQQEKYVIQEGSRVNLSLNGQTVLTGWVDRMSPSYDTQSHSLTLSGRDLTCDLVDCSYIGDKVDFAGEELLTIAKALCDPFNITVTSETDISGQLAKARYGQGESVHAFLLKLCRLKGVLPISYGDGRLVLATAGSQSSGGSLEQGANIKTASANFDSSRRFSEYRVKGQGTPPMQFDWPDPNQDEKERLENRRQFVSPKGVATDKAVKRYRPLVLIAEGAAAPADMEARASWEAVNRAGQSRGASYTVTGWGPKAGQFWRINQKVSVQDPILGLSGRYLIESVRLSQDESGGTVSSLSVVHPDAYAAKPKADKASDIKSFFDK